MPYSRHPLHQAGVMNPWQSWQAFSRLQNAHNCSHDKVVADEIVGYTKTHRVCLKTTFLPALFLRLRIWNRILILLIILTTSLAFAKNNNDTYPKSGFLMSGESESHVTGIHPCPLLPVNAPEARI